MHSTGTYLMGLGISCDQMVSCLAVSIYSISLFDIWVAKARSYMAQMKILSWKYQFWYIYHCTVIVLSEYIIHNNVSYP
jgi:hypothetical protein